ncbi:MAG: zinc ribbon domain-containing protein [Isosphaeraceae bacterium]
MSTIDLSCPACGRVGSVPREKAHARLVCPKCHAVFHMSAAGRAVLGEPHSEHHGIHDEHHHHHHHPTTHHEAAAGRDWDEIGMPAFTSPKFLLFVAVATACLGAYEYLGSAATPDSLADRAQAVADAMATDRPPLVLENSLASGQGEAEKFYRNWVEPRLATLRKHSTASELSARVLVLEVNPEKTQAQVVGTFTPVQVSSRDKAIDEAAALISGKEETTAEFTLWWTKDDSGRWKLDGHKCLERRGRL